MDESTRYWLAFGRIKGSSALIKGVVERYGGAAGLFSESHAALKALYPGIAGEVASFSLWKDIDEEICAVERFGARIVSFADAEYPSLLRATDDPPCALYMKGLEFDNDAASISIVGTRSPTHYGIRMAESIAAGLASCGVLVTSGLARGCDSSAHRGAISAGGRTAAIVGTGLDVVYPRENARLQADIAERGTLITEYPMATPPVPYNFPRRNRLIGGVSIATVVVEAPLRSGSLQTARLALDYNREVFAVPGQAGLHRSAGSNRLIKDGAPLVESALDIITALGLEPTRPAVGVSGQRASSVDAPGGDDERVVFDAVGSEPVHIDAISEKTGLKASSASSALLGLELKGLVRQLPGKLFVRALI